MCISSTEFNEAVSSCGFSVPSSRVCSAFKSTVSDFSRNEAAMFLAQLIHESGGFRYREEIAYAGNNHHGAYVDSVGLPGKTYHGRGYIQLTWGANYKAASRGLGLGDKLLKNPELVAEDVQLSMDVSGWYWRAVVRPMMGDGNSFGLTTKAINGAIECSGGYNATARKRYDYYLKVARACGIRNPSSECGCYN